MRNQRAIFLLLLVATSLVALAACTRTTVGPEEEENAPDGQQVSNTNRDIEWVEQVAHELSARLEQREPRRRVVGEPFSAEFEIRPDPVTLAQTISFNYSVVGVGPVQSSSSPRRASVSHAPNALNPIVFTEVKVRDLVNLVCTAPGRGGYTLDITEIEGAPGVSLEATLSITAEIECVEDCPPGQDCGQFANANSCPAAISTCDLRSTGHIPEEGKSVNWQTASIPDTSVDIRLEQLEPRRRNVGDQFSVSVEIRQTSDPEHAFINDITYLVEGTGSVRSDHVAGRAVLGQKFGFQLLNRRTITDVVPLTCEKEGPGGYTLYARTSALVLVRSASLSGEIECVEDEIGQLVITGTGNGGNTGDPGAPLVEVPGFDRPTQTPPTATAEPQEGSFEALAPGTYPVTLHYQRTNDCNTPTTTFSRAGAIVIAGGRGVDAVSNNLTINDGNATYRGLIDLATGEIDLPNEIYTGVLDSSFETGASSPDRSDQPKLTFSLQVAAGCTAVFEVALQSR